MYRYFIFDILLSFKVHWYFLLWCLIMLLISFSQIFISNTVLSSLEV